MEKQYFVIDTVTGNRVYSCMKLRTAKLKADVLDWQYGAVRYVVKTREQVLAENERQLEKIRVWLGS